MGFEVDGILIIVMLPHQIMQARDIRLELFFIIIHAIIMLKNIPLISKLQLR